MPINTHQCCQIRTKDSLNRFSEFRYEEGVRLQRESTNNVGDNLTNFPDIDDGEHF